MRGGLTIDIYIPKGIVKSPSALTKFWWFVGSNPIVFLPFVTLVVMFGAVVVRWAAIPIRAFRLPRMYEPPKGMTPAEAGTLLEDRFIRATLRRRSWIWRCGVT